MVIIECPQGYAMCPYEESHVILIEKLQFHLAKCKYVNKNAPLTECPYNSTHKVPLPEINNHKLYLCPDRKKIDNFIYKTENSDPLFEVKNLVIESGCSEDWDDVQHPTYDPVEACKNKAVLLLKQGVTISERKEFRAQERKRMQMFLSGPMKEPLETPPQSQRLPQTKPMAHIEPTPKAGPSTAADEPLEPAVREPQRTKPKNDGFVVPRYARGRGRNLHH